ncbi:frataxin homolog, mitochondrial [Galleria mellonella]|uniref:ferroxidase n=1 Tax=Galleria mellonella TaxID=7137 RepID=A0ABM3MXI1_GALME|nr:frataxin homolog, mitochondrial [Galleria mellonella]
MFKNIVRFNRWLVRKQIYSRPYVIVRQYSQVSKLQSVINNPCLRLFSASKNVESPPPVNPADFEEICNETLESLCEYFEELVEQSSNLKGADVTYSDGVLTVFLGADYGTYVINRQSPNKQIWLSSPVSGPKRYDLIPKNGGYWVYRHDGVSLHRLLQDEISKIVENKVDFKNCAHSLV